MNKYYISSCVFTSRFPELSFKIQDYIEKRYGISVVRCCTPKYKLKIYEEKMPVGKLRDKWSKLADTGNFSAGDEVWSLCHNCNNIIEEVHPDVKVCSLWELIDSDDEFPLSDYSGLKVTIQDCWRAKNRNKEQNAVRNLLRKMNIDIEELNECRDKTEFCGVTLYQNQPPRNPKLAPKYYLEGAVGKFIPHSEKEQEEIMKEYCKQFKTDTVICYCHYCLEGLEIGGINAKHIAELLFKDM